MRGRLRASDPRPRNAATVEADYRRDTAKMNPFAIPTMRRCPCCSKLRTSRQYVDGSPYCESCRRVR